MGKRRVRNCRQNTLSLYSTADVYSSSSRQRACEERRSRRGWRRSILSASFFEGLLRYPVLTPKTVGAALVEVFAVILPVEATTPPVDAPPDIGSEHGVCDA